MKRKEGERLVIEPARPASLLEVLATLAPFAEELPPIADLDPRSGRALMRRLLHTNIVVEML